jgi:hypothetical protein
MAEVLNVLRSAAFVRIGDRTVMVEGEGHAPVPGSPGWVIYTNAMRYDPPYLHEPVDDATRREVIATLTGHFTEKGIQFTID